MIKNNENAVADCSSRAGSHRCRPTSRFFTILPLLTGMVLLALATSTGAAQLEKDSVDFPLQLEMDESPTPVFGVVFAGGWPVVDGILTVDVDWDQSNAAAGWLNEISDETGYTIEIRFQIVEVNQPPTGTAAKYTFQLQGADASGTGALNVIQVGAAWEGSELGLYSQFGVLAAPLTYEWHTVRFLEEPNSNEMRVWLDGEEIVDFNWQPGNNATVNRACFGDFGGNVTDGIYRVDYFRVDNTGSFAPPGSGGAMTELRIVDLKFENDAFFLSFETEAGTNYQVEYKDALDEAEWQPLEEVAGVGEVMQVNDPTASSVQRRFYRVRLLAVPGS